MSFIDKWIKAAGAHAVLTIITGDDDEREVRVPYRFEICPACGGSGGTSRHVECDGGGFTASEWGDLDDDFREDYLAGHYDRPCDECRRHPGRVMVPDLDRLSPADREAWDSQVNDERDFQAVCAAERRMGA